MFMGEASSLELGLSLGGGPVILLERSNVLISTFSNERTRTDSSVASIGELIFAVSFMKNNCVHCVYFRESVVPNVSQDSIEKQLEVCHSAVATIEIMESTDTVEVCDCGFDRLEEFLGL